MKKAKAAKVNKALRFLNDLNAENSQLRYELAAAREELEETREWAHREIRILRRTIQQMKENQS